MVKLQGPSRRRVFTKRNSSFNVPIEWLDQSCWWTDGDDIGLYLHVHGLASADPKNHHGLGERVFRVYPRIPKGYRQRPRLSFEKGELYWLLDPERAL